MNLILLIIFLHFQTPIPPAGIWLHKEDGSRIEIIYQDKQIGGKIISSRNAKYANLKILREFEFSDGLWRGEFYDVKNKRWVRANLIIAEKILVVQYKYGFIEKKFYLNKAFHN